MSNDLKNKLQQCTDQFVCWITVFFLSIHSNDSNKDSPPLQHLNYSWSDKNIEQTNCFSVNVWTEWLIHLYGLYIKMDRWMTTMHKSNFNIPHQSIHSWLFKVSKTWPINCSILYPWICWSCCIYCSCKNKNMTEWRYHL